MADSTDKMLRDYFSGRLKLMAEIDTKHKQEIADITFCLSVIQPEHIAQSSNDITVINS